MIHKTQILLIAAILALSSCDRNEISISDLPQTYKPYDNSWTERLVWKFRGIDTVLYGGSIQIIDSNSYLYEGCYCKVSGEWEQRNDSLFLHHIEFGFDTTSVLPPVDCTKLDSIYLIKKNGDLLEVVDNRQNVIHLFALVKD